MSGVYTNYRQYGDAILVREVIDGQPSMKRVEYSPTLYLRSSKTTPYKNIYGESLNPKYFDTIKEAKLFQKQFEGTSQEVFGNAYFDNQYIIEQYPQSIDFKFEDVSILSIDIETQTESGFPDPDIAQEEVLLITVKNYHTKERVTFGTKPYGKNDDHYVFCENETILLKKFVSFFRKVSPDIITGWNIKFFDVPYLVNRVIRVLGDSFAKKFSPWGIVFPKTYKTKFNKEVVSYDIYGVSMLDYMELYTKFTYVKREDYRLDTIAEIELGKQKLKSPHPTFKDFYTKDWDLFVEYNIVDTELVDALEDKLRLIELAVTMAYDAKCNFSDVFSAVRTWDSLINSYLSERNIIASPIVEREKEKLIGAFVQSAKGEVYDWVVSFDATSLYPSIIMHSNISPETLLPESFECSPEKLLSGEVSTDGFRGRNVALTANGRVFKKDVRGIFPTITERIFEDRVKYKKLTIAAKAEMAKNPSEELKKTISKYNNIQMARKILLNSLYGASGNVYFRYFSHPIAEGVTLTGQYIIKKVAEDVNAHLNEMFGTSEQVYVVYSDTDSVYISLGERAKSLVRDSENPQAIVDGIIAFCEEHITKILDESCEEIYQKLHGDTRSITFKRESVAARGIWLAKKKYILSVWDDEGVRYSSPTTKISGLEMIKSSTPKKVRIWMRETLEVMLQKTQKDVQEKIQSIRDEFSTIEPEAIAFPRTVNDLSKHRSESTIYKKGKGNSTPIHVRACLLYNYYIKERDLSKLYQKIESANSIKYIYLEKPNPIQENVIGYLTELPKEFDLHRFVDRKKMFEKVFLSPMQSILDCFDWDAAPVATLNDVF